MSDHHPGCAGADTSTRTNSVGIRWTTCKSCCGHWRTGESSAAAPRVVGYVCREHPSEPVTWRGTGCTLCPKRKAKKRRAPQREDNER